MSPRVVVLLGVALSTLVAVPAAAEPPPPDGAALEAPAPAPAPVPASVPAEALEIPTPAPEVTPVPDADDLADLNWAGFGVRLGIYTLDVAAEDVPFFSDEVQQAIDAFNKLNPDSKKSRSALDLKADMTQVIPTLHLGGDGFFFRLDVPVAFGDGLTSLGLGIYPLAYGYFIESIGLFPYLVAGGAAHYLSSGSVTARGAKVDVSQSGGILQARVALGAKIRTVGRLNGVFEVGYSPWLGAGMVDTGKLKALRNATDPLSLPDPSEAVRAGLGSAIDFSAGIEWM
jgi:hypothetical protein